MVALFKLGLKHSFAHAFTPLYKFYNNKHNRMLVENALSIKLSNRCFVLSKK